jgi:hypothetical protein
MSKGSSWHPMRGDCRVVCDESIRLARVALGPMVSPGCCWIRPGGSSYVATCHPRSRCGSGEPVAMGSRKEA